MNNEFLVAYSKLLDSINSIKKESENPFFKSKYADLNTIFEEVKTKIKDNGFILLQTPIFKDGRNFLNTKIFHIESGDFLEGEVELLTVKADMQQLGSAITYARRYSILPMLNIETEDDDGNIACGNKAPEPQTVDDFKKLIENATNEKYLGSLWYKYKVIFAQDSAEYKELNKLASTKKLALGNPNLKVG